VIFSGAPGLGASMDCAFNAAVAIPLSYPLYRSVANLYIFDDLTIA